MRIAWLVSREITGLHGRFDPRVLWTQEHRALTGSEGTFFLIAQELGKRHDVTLYCDTLWEGKAHGIEYRQFGTELVPADAYIAQDNPLVLTQPGMSPGAQRVLWRQCNQFVEWGPAQAQAADVWIAASPIHQEFLTQIAPVDWTWLPNPVNLDLFKGEEERKPNTIVWCSSPDRGLHRLIEIFPDIRRQVPDAELRVYYRFDPWYEAAKDVPGPLGNRARFIHECLKRLGRNGEKGLYMMGPTPNSNLARELMKTSVFAYTCDPVAFTEGFSVSTMDACAAGALPIISDADAIGDVYDGIAHVIPGRPGANRQIWIDAIVKGLQDEQWAAPIRERARQYAQRFSVARVARLWEKVLLKEPRAATIKEFAESAA